MVQLRIFTNEIGPDGELVDRLAAAIEVHGQELRITEGDARHVQVGIPVFSERYGGLIDFELDGEEWARNLPSAYRTGAVTVTVDNAGSPEPPRLRAVAATYSSPRRLVH